MHSPEYPHTYINYGQLLFTVDKFDELEALLLVAIGVPAINKVHIYQELGLMYEFRHDFEKAIAQYKSAADLCGSDPMLKWLGVSIERCLEKTES